MASLNLQNVQKSYAGTPIIKGLTLDIVDREFIVLVGPSGSGKSTLIRMIAGLEEIDDGSLLIDGVEVNQIGPADRGLAMVFQSYALYPHMSVRQNMSFALRLAGVSAEVRNRKVAEAARILHLEEYLDYKPAQLSGGQRQRVAIGRAIVRAPRAFLLDEPLSNLDASLRGQMRVELARLHKELNTTMIYVTHDQVEAMTMADRIVVMQSGRIEQVGTPLEIYHHPVNIFVARFMGSPQMNILPGRVVAIGENSLTVEVLGGARVCVAVKPGSARLDDTMTLGVRPEALHPDPAGGFHGTVSVVEHLGAHSLAYMELDSSASIIAQINGDNPLRPQERLALAVDPRLCHVFDSNGLALVRSNCAPADT